MASPSNANEPEPSDEEEEEYVEAGFDPLLFWDQYRQVILVAGGVILLGLVVFTIYQFNQSQRIAAAGAALAQATKEEEFRQVIDQHPGTVAAGDATLFLAGHLREDKKYDEAMQVLQAFLDKFPTHPLAGGGDLSYAETLEAAGRMDEAIARYQEVAAKYPDSYAAPLAIIAQANILKSQGKINEARRMYENFLAQFPDSVFSQEATAEMHLLRPTGSAAAAGPETKPATPLSLGTASAAPSPLAAPSATPPILPAIPGASPQ